MSETDFSGQVMESNSRVQRIYYGLCSRTVKVTGFKKGLNEQQFKLNKSHYLTITNIKNKQYVL